MTETKMTKILLDLSSKKDYGVFYLIDVWQFDPSKRVREIIKVSDLAKEFKEREGRFYKKYKINCEFKSLIEHIKKGEEMKIECYYKDTHEAYLNEWKKDHPNENYETWIKNQKKKNRRKYFQYMGSYGLYGSKINSVIKNVYL